MRVYQIKLKGKNFGVPFARYNDMVQMLDKLKDHETTVTIQMLETQKGDAYRDGNTIIVDGIIRGVYYNDQPEHI